MSMIHSSCALLGLQVRAERRHREVQHGQVHGVDEAARAITASPIHSRRVARAGTTYSFVACPTVHAPSGSKPHVLRFAAVRSIFQTARLPGAHR